MISIATHGRFWPQAGHGIWSDPGAYGVNGVGSCFDFNAPDRKCPKLTIRKISERDGSCKPKLTIVLEQG